MPFTKAVRYKARARVALIGPSGSGKTMSALLMAAGFGGTVAVIDSERRSASLYAGMPGIPDFDVLDLAPPYTPERYIDAIEAASGYGVVIIDSATHEWNGIGGCMEIVDTLAANKFKGNTWSAYSVVTPRHRRFIDAIINSPAHVIITIRAKTDTAQINDAGKTRVVKLGMKPEQREGIEFEMTTAFDLTHDGHFATQSKDRTGLFVGRDPFVISADTGREYRDWLESGAEPPAPPPEAPMPESPEAAEPELPDADFQCLMADIESAASMIDLRRVYNRAWKRCTSNEQRSQLERSKDARKHALETAATQPDPDATA